MNQSEKSAKALKNAYDQFEERIRQEERERARKIIEGIMLTRPQKLNGVWSEDWEEVSSWNQPLLEALKKLNKT